MRNDKISASQFWITMFLITLVSLLFIDNTTSLVQIVCVVLTSLVNFLVIVFYNGKNNIVMNSCLLVYYFITSTFVLQRFVYFMHKAVESGPYWSLLIIMTITLLFCTTKGIEALTRAAVIISFFVVIFLLYIFASTIKDLKLLSQPFDMSSCIFPSIVLLFPTAAYASLKNRITENKKYPIIVYTVASVAATGYSVILALPVKTEFPLYSLTKKAQLGVFKGADFLLLVVLTISVVFLISSSVNNVCWMFTSKTPAILLLLLISAAAAASLYVESVNEVITSESFQSATTVFIVIVLICNTIFSVIADGYKKHKKSKKN